MNVKTPSTSSGRRVATRVFASATVVAVLAACGGGDGKADAASSTTQAPTTTLASDSLAIDVAAAIGCDNAVPDVDEREVSGGALPGEYPTIEFNLRGGIKAAATSSATCFSGADEVLIFAGPELSSLEGTKFFSDVITEDHKCLPGETWTYLNGGNWLVIAGGGTTESRYSVAKAAKAKISGNLVRISC